MNKLTERELDAHNIEFHAQPTVEQEHPATWFLYAVGVVAAAAASALLPIWQVTP